MFNGCTGVAQCTRLHNATTFMSSFTTSISCLPIHLPLPAVLTIDRLPVLVPVPL